jgi:hypothetical protein
LSRKIDKSVVRNILDQKDLIWVDEIYVNNRSPLYCVCSGCGLVVFPTYHDNSELWDLNKLKEIGIL